MERYERFKILRILGGFTQEELAARANIPKSSIGAMERGLYAPSGDTGLAIAEALRVPFEYLYNGCPPPDSNSPLVWIVSPPQRSQHIQKIINEICALFPVFLEENNFEVLVPCELADGGGAFLIGRFLDNRSGAKEREIALSCLLLSDRRFVDVLMDAFRAAELVMMEKTKIRDNGIEYFNAEDLYRIFFDYKVSKIPIDKIISELSKLKENNEIGKSINTGAIKYLFQIFAQVLRNYVVTDDKYDAISEIFLHMSHEIGSLSKDNIDTHILEQEIRRKIDHIGCQWVADKPPQIQTESQEMDYRLLREWLREKWLSIDDEEKCSFVDWLKQKSDFGEWLEKYDKEVREGKRMMIMDF